MEHLSPRQVALAIGVSEASLKRWCDKGVIEATRTVGGHRRLPLHAVLRFLQESGRAPIRPEILGLPSTTGKGKTTSARAVSQGADALAAGDEQAFQRIVIDLHLAGQPFPAIADEVIAPVLAEIGRRWEAGHLEIYQERRGCEICLRTLNRLQWLFAPPAPDAPRAIGGATEGDWFAVPVHMAELALRAAGWQAESLGVHLPFSTLVAAIRQLRPRLVWLSASTTESDERLIAGCTRLFDVAGAQGATLAVGGRAFRAEVCKALPGIVCCTGMTELSELARELALGAAALQTGSSPRACR